MLPRVRAARAGVAGNVHDPAANRDGYTGLIGLQHLLSEQSRTVSGLPSVVIRRTIENVAPGVFQAQTETFVPARALSGVLPEFLLREYTFWKVRGPSGLCRAVTEVEGRVEGGGPQSMVALLCDADRVAHPRVPEARL